jgi:glycosyltransferase involved in cell wall biosynthesis
MRVLVQIRPDHASQEGGDTVHATRTAEQLTQFGVDVEVSGEVAPDLDRYDLVHLFNTEIVEPTFRHALRARSCGIPVVLSPVFWRGEPIRDEAFAVADRENLSRREWAMRAIVYGLADVLVPNSQAEADVIAARFPVRSDLVIVAKLGVDPAFAHGDGARFSERHGLPQRGFVLSAARIEPRKNQHRLIMACTELGVPLVLAGAVYEDRRAYADECKALAAEGGTDVRFLPHLGAAELADAYAAARVHALPSLWESVGLSSVEAALAGCAVVSTDNCGVHEYLGDEAWYCDPESFEAIREAVASAWASEPSHDLPAAAALATWPESARATVAAYELAMSRSSEDTWSAPLSQDAYIEHLEALIQLQLETIALRDAHYASVRESAAEAIRYAKSLEEERERLEGHVRKPKDESRSGLGRVRARLRRR